MVDGHSTEREVLPCVDYGHAFHGSLVNTASFRVFLSVLLKHVWVS